MQVDHEDAATAVINATVDELILSIPCHHGRLDSVEWNGGWNGLEYRLHCKALRMRERP